MRQRVTHGAELDIATPDEMAGLIARAFELQQIENYDRKRGVIQLDATGGGRTSSPDQITVPAQFDLILERIAVGGSGMQAAMTILLYENDVSTDVNLLEVIDGSRLGNSLKYSDSFSNNIYVPANSALIIAVAGGVAGPGTQVTFNLQGRLRKHRP